jgi:hypothetical protein
MRLVSRGHFLAAAFAALAGCVGRTSKDPLPAAAGAWRRAAVEPLPVEQADPEARRLGLKLARRAVYEGPEPLAVTCYEMTSSAGAFEMQQKWRPLPGRLAFHSAHFFVVIEGAGGNRQAPAGFARALEENMK